MLIAIIGLVTWALFPSKVAPLAGLVLCDSYCASDIASSKLSVLNLPVLTGLFIVGFIGSQTIGLRIVLYMAAILAGAAITVTVIVLAVQAVMNRHEDNTRAR